MVSVICHTYNHEKFLQNAIDGFLLQKTNFDFEIIIHDDASTDGTKKIIEAYHSQYPNKIHPIYQSENQFSQRKNISANYTYPIAKGKYIALCEGDDYWTDPDKLQKQVDFLEANPDYVICWTNFIQKHEDSWIETGFATLFPEVYTIDLDTIFQTYNTYTLTTVFRRDTVATDFILQCKYAKDNTIYCLALFHGKGAFLNFKSAVYRWHSGGIYSLQSSFFQNYSSYCNLKEIYETIAPAQTENIRMICNGLLKNAAFALFQSEDKKKIPNAVKRKVMTAYFFSASFKNKIKYLKFALKNW